jgi:hypothetical protein
MKPWIKVEFNTEWEQSIFIQPTPENDGLEIRFSEIDGTHKSPLLSISKNDLPYLIDKMKEMMDYVTSK